MLSDMFIATWPRVTDGFFIITHTFCRRYSRAVWLRPHVYIQCYLASAFVHLCHLLVWNLSFPVGQYFIYSNEICRYVTTIASDVRLGFAENCVYLYLYFTVMSEKWAMVMPSIYPGDPSNNWLQSTYCNAPMAIISSSLTGHWVPRAVFRGISYSILKSQ